MKKFLVSSILLFGAIAYSQTLNYSSTLPAAPSGNINITWQHDTGHNPTNASAYTPLQSLTGIGSPIITCSATINNHFFYISNTLQIYYCSNQIGSVYQWNLLYQPTSINGVSSNGSNGMNVVGVVAASSVSVSANPTTSLQLAPKQYVDASVLTETNRAETTESYLSSSISNEVSRAELSEGSLNTSGNAETIRAEAVEVSLASSIVIASSQTQVLSSAFTSSSTGSKICAIESPPLTCNGGVGSVAVYSTVQNYGLSSPTMGSSLINSTAYFALTTESSGGADVLWPSVIGINDTASSFKRESWFTMTDSSALYLGNLEADIYQSRVTDTRLAMFGWQCNRFDTGYWQYANESSSWTNTAIPCNLVFGHNYHMILKVHGDPIGTNNCSGVPCEYWDSFQWDDLTAATSVIYPLSITMPTTSTSWASTVGAQWQLDAEHIPSSSHVTVGIYAEDILTAYSINGQSVVAASYCGSLSGSIGCIITNISGVVHYIPYW